MQALAGGAPGVRTQGTKGDDGSHTASPPPLQRDECRASRLRRACDVLTPEDGQRGRPPPPPTPFSPTHPGKGRGQPGGGEGTWGGGGAEDTPTCQGERRAASGGDGKKKQRTKQTNAPGEESEKTGTKTATTGGRPGRHGPARDTGEVPDLGGMGAPKGNPPPPHCSLALCLRRACVVPATCVLQREDDKGDKGDDGSGTRTPPRGQRGRVGRQR